MVVTDYWTPEYWNRSSTSWTTAPIQEWRVPVREWRWIHRGWVTTTLPSPCWLTASSALRFYDWVRPASLAAPSDPFLSCQSAQIRIDMTSVEHELSTSYHSQHRYRWVIDPDCKANLQERLWRWWKRASSRRAAGAWRRCRSCAPPRILLPSSWNCALLECSWRRATTWWPPEAWTSMTLTTTFWLSWTIWNWS